MFSLLQKIYAYFPFFSHYKRIGEVFRGFNNKSYHSERKINKSKVTQVVDYLYIFLKLQYLPANYHLFGFDQKKRTEFKDYIGCTSTDPYYAKKAYPLFGRNTVLIDDKLTFNIICNHHKLPVPKIFGFYPNESGINLRDLMIENKIENIVLKPQFGAYGSGIHFISIDDLFSLKEPLIKGDYILEESIKQHSDLNKINPHSINSIRVITIILPDGNVEFLGAMLKASSSTLPVDNFSMGGIVVGINMSTGKLKKEGFVKYSISEGSIEKQNAKNLDSSKHTLDTKKQSKLRPGRIILEHPLTGTEFYNFEIPFWDELKRITINAQKTFKTIKSIGWDIAIGPDGPLLIEGNRLWGTAGIQAANGGLLTKKNRVILKKHRISFL